MAEIVRVEVPHHATETPVEQFLADDHIRVGDYCWATQRDSDRPGMWHLRRATGGDELALVALQDARPGDSVFCAVIGGIHGARYHQLLAEAFA